jgi:hypothetical protein
MNIASPVPCEMLDDVPRKCLIRLSCVAVVRVCRGRISVRRLNDRYENPRTELSTNPLYWQAGRSGGRVEAMGRCRAVMALLNRGITDLRASGPMLPRPGIAVPLELNNKYEGVAGAPSPVRGGGPVAPARDREARLAVSRLAGHARIRASGAYVGGNKKRSGPQDARSDPAAGTERGNDDDASVDV